MAAEEPMNVDDMLEDALNKSEPSANLSSEKENGENASEAEKNSKEKKRASRSRSRSRSKDRSKKKKRSSSRDKDRKKRSRSRKRSRSKDRRRSRSRDRADRDRRRRSRSRSKKRSRSRDRRRSQSRNRDRSDRRRSRSRGERERRRSRSRERRRSRSPMRPRVIDHRDRRSPIRRRSMSPPRGRLPGPERRDVMPFTAKNSPPPNAKLDMTAEERDQRTVFILQIARMTRPRDLEEFFSSVGSVRDVRIITDSRTRRSKGICYVEFWEEEAVPLALALNGQKLLGAPLVIQRTCAERNRAANATVGGALGFGPANPKGAVKLCVSQLHPHINDEMLSGIFDPFGRIDNLEIKRDAAGNSTGTAYITFKHPEDATKAVEQLNGFEVAGKAMKVMQVDESDEGSTRMDKVTDEGSGGVALGQAGRLQLMANLAKDKGMELPPQAQEALKQQAATEIPAIATQCFMLSNMFDPAKETDPGWQNDVKDDVIEECYRWGGAVHVFVDNGSAEGNVYVKCPSVAIAHKCVLALHGRFFSGKVITANYVPVQSYHDLFPDSMRPGSVLPPRGGANPVGGFA